MMTKNLNRRSGVFITGTDTNVGKTVVSSLIVTALQDAKISVGYFKPVQTGTDLDCDTIRKLGGHSIESPVYAFHEPIAPYRAALLHQSEISIDRIKKRWEELPTQTWVVEGAGGLLVPLNQRDSIRELVAALNIPLIIVASTRLGTINHTLLTIESASRAGLEILGIVFVGDDDPGLMELIRDLTGVSVLARIPILPQLSASAVREMALELFPIERLRDWFGNA